MEDVTPAGGQPAPTPPPANSGSGDNQPNTQPGSPAVSQGANEGQEKQDPTPPGTPPVQDPSKEDEEPPVRKSKLDYIRERLEAKRQKQENRQTPAPAPQPQPKLNNQDPNPSGDEDFTPEEEAKFSKFFEKKFGDKFKVVDQLTETTERDHVDNEVTEFFKNDPHADLLKEFEGKIRKYAQHPSRSQVPIDEMVWGIAGKKLITFAAEAVRKAQKEARESQAGGSSARKPEGGSKKDAWTMTPEEFAAEQQRVLTQQR